MSAKTRAGVLKWLGWLAAMLIAASASAADLATKKTKRVDLPTILYHKGEQCVEPTEDMRRNHMNYILHQRDETMHRGIRTSKHSLKECINCHADPKTNSVLGPEGFCESCHTYAAVSMDCFSCHTPTAEQKAAALYPPNRLLDMVNRSTPASALGAQP